MSKRVLSELPVFSGYAAPAVAAGVPANIGLFDVDFDQTDLATGAITGTGDIDGTGGMPVAVGDQIIIQRATVTQSPSGAGYALENRIALSRSFPEAFRDCQAERLASRARDGRFHRAQRTPLPRG